MGYSGLAAPAMLVAGIDPAVRRPSALCLLGSLNLATKGELEELLLAAKGLGAQAIAVDSPLSEPKGPWREVDKLARRLGLKVLPPGWRSMRALTARVLKALKETGVEAVETFPRGVKARPWWFADLDDDLFDACLAALAALAFVKGSAFKVVAEDGEIVLDSPWEPV